MAARRGDDRIRVSRVDHGSAQRERLAHRRAGAVHAQKGNAELTRRETCRNDLVQQIPRNQKIDFFLGEIGVLYALFDGIGEHFALRFFVRLFVEHIVIERKIYVFTHDPFRFLRSRDRRRGDDLRSVIKINGMTLHCNLPFCF